MASNKAKLFLKECNKTGHDKIGVLNVEGKWTWRLVSGKYDIVCKMTYTRKRDAKRAAKRVSDSLNLIIEE